MGNADDETKEIGTWGIVWRGTLLLMFPPVLVLAGYILVDIVVKAVGM